MITDEEYQEALTIVQARQEQEEARKQAELEALREPVEALVSSPEYEYVITEAKRIVEEYPDSGMYYSIHLNALILGARNLKSTTPSARITNEEPVAP